MNGWEPACDTITRRSGLPRNAHLHAHIYREVAQFLKTTDFVDFDLHRSDGRGGVWGWGGDVPLGSGFRRGETLLYLP